MLIAVLTGCAAPAIEDPPRGDSARRAFGDSASAALLDTTLYELRAQLFVKVINPDRDDESPIADRVVPHPATPGPHTLNGTLYAELTVLQDLLGSVVPTRVDTARDHVFLGNPPVLLLSHRHDGRVYVPVKLYARQLGAYTDIACTFANCGFIWPRAIIEHMRAIGATGGSGILEGHAEGIVKDVDVTRRPSG